MTQGENKRLLGGSFIVTDFLVICVLIVAFAITVSSIDDLFIDLLATGITRSSAPSQVAGTIQIPLTAVFVANWQEEEVLEKMVEGNLARIPYDAVVLYLGVYPNDIGTLRVAEALEAKHPSRVHVIVNSLDGPTSKGQMLNEMFRQLYGYDSEDAPQLVVLHDSEDIIDPRTFPVYAAYAASGFDFVQVPVLSLSRKKGTTSPLLTWTSSQNATRAKWSCVTRSAQ